MQCDGRMRVNSVVSDNSGSGRKNGELMKTEKNKKTKRSEGTRKGKTIYITKWYPDTCSRVATIDMGRKLGAVPFGGSWVPI